MHSLLCSLLATFLTAMPIAQSMPEAADALDGLDPVMLIAGKEVPGKSALSVTRGGFTYLFSTAETKATFEADPGKYEIQLGGLCARMGKTAGGNPADFLVHDGKIYVFGSDACHKKFAAAPAKFLAPAPDPMPSSTAATVKARQLLDRAVAAIGGAGRIDGLSSYVESFSQVQSRPQGDVAVVTKTIWSFPDRVRQERTMTMQGKASSSATILSPQGMWFVSGQGEPYPIRRSGPAQSRTGLRAAPRRSLAPSTRSRLQSVRARASHGWRRHGRKRPRPFRIQSMSRSASAPAAVSTARLSTIGMPRVRSVSGRSSTRTSARSRACNFLTLFGQRSTACPSRSSR